MREELLAFLRGKNPGLIPRAENFDIMALVFEHGKYLEKDGETAIDWFGQSWTQSHGSTVPTPNMHALADITEWKGIIPSDETIDAFDWAGFCQIFTCRFDRENHVSDCIVPAGFFERLHHVMGFENALCALYEEPEAVHEFLRDLLRYKKRVLFNLKKYANPDMITFMDDYGTAQNMFMSRDMWLEFFAPYLKEIIDYAHELGFIFLMHSCGYITPIVGDMVEMGIDVLNPLQGHNDIEGIKKAYGDRIVINGGVVESVMGAPDSTEADIRAQVRRCVEVLAPGGNFYPPWNPPGADSDERRALIARVFNEELKARGFEPL